MPTIEEILRTAKEMGASDVHLTVGIPPKARVKGSLLTMDYPRLQPGDTLDLMIGIMPERGRAQFEEKGEYDMSFSVQGLGRYRVHAYKQRGFVAMAMRLLDAEVPAADSLRIPQSVLDLYECEKGLILVAGAAGSGRSTTLACLVDMINNNRYSHVLTLENPIEYLHHPKLSMINQREIGEDSESYAGALRAALREDVDVIQVGEMFDAETVSAAITAAETGHLVLASMHTVGIEDTLDYLIDLFPPYRQKLLRIRLANVLEAVVSQRLVSVAEGGRHMVDFEVLHVDEAVRANIREGKINSLSNL